MIYILPDGQGVNPDHVTSITTRKSANRDSGMVTIVHVAQGIAGVEFSYEGNIVAQLAKEMNGGTS